MGRKHHLETYDGDNRFSFVNATIWQCIKFWLITKLTGGEKPIGDNNEDDGEPG